MAKSLVKAGLCSRALIQVAYAIGVAEPLSINVETYGTSAGKSEEELVAIVKRNFDLRPGCLIRDLKLKQSGYLKTAAYGHFGRQEFAWEQAKTLEM